MVAFDIQHMPEPSLIARLANIANFALQNPRLHGEAIVVAAREVQSFVWRASNVHGTYFAVSPSGRLDGANAEDALRKYALESGIDFDELVASAAAHFTSNEICRRKEPLTAKELESLREDDKRAFDR